MKKRILALIFTMVLVLGMASNTAFADGSLYLNGLFDEGYPVVTTPVSNYGLAFDNDTGTAAGIPWGQNITINFPDTLDIREVKYSGYNLSYTYYNASGGVIYSDNHSTWAIDVVNGMDIIGVKKVVIEGYNVNNNQGSLIEFEVYADKMDSFSINLTSTVTKILVDWPDISGAQSYKIYLNSSLVDTIESSISEYEFSGLASNTSYNVRVQAYCPGYISSEAMDSIYTLDYFSARPTVGSNEIDYFYAKINWSAVQDTQYYEVKLGATGEISQTTDTFKLFENLNPGTNYTAYVRQVNLGGTASQWLEIPFRTLNVPEVPPAAPGNITVISKGTNFIEVQVTSSLWATGYKYYLNNVLITTIPGTTYRFTGLNPNTSYSIGVRSYNDYGTSLMPAGVITSTDEELIPKVTNASSSFVGGNTGKQNVSWTGKNVVSGYKLLVDGQEVGTYPSTTNSAEIDFAALGLTGDTHEIEVVPSDAGGVSYKFQTVSKSTGSQDLDAVTGNILNAKNVIFSGGKYLLMLIIAVLLLFIIINFIYNKMKLNLATADHDQLEADPDIALNNEQKTKLDRENFKNAKQEESQFYKVKKESQDNSAFEKFKSGLAKAVLGGSSKKREKAYYVKEVTGSKKVKVNKQDFYNLKHSEFNSLKNEFDFKLWQNRFSDYSQSSFNKFHKKSGKKGYSRG